MIKRILFILPAFFFILSAYSQEFYSYISDRRFLDPTDLIGYAFNPDLMEIPEKDISRPLTPGSYSFGIAPNNLYVFGDDIKGLYNVNQIKTTEYGFQLVLLDTWDPGKKGHLKVIITPAGFAEALIFRRSQLEPEMVFFLPPLPEDKGDQETKWFTDLGEAVVSHPDSLYGMTFRPFLRIQNDPRIQQRFQIRDSTEIRFIEEVEVVEKMKKKKPAKEENVAIAFDADSLLSDSVIADTSLFEIRRKITKKHFIEVRTVVDDDISGRKEMLWREEIKGVNEKSDSQATGMQEKFMINIQTVKGSDFALFLTARRTFSSIDLGGEVYLARGR